MVVYPGALFVNCYFNSIGIGDSREVPACYMLTNRELAYDGLEHARDARGERGEAAEAALDRVLEAIRVLLKEAHRVPRIEGAELRDQGVAAVLWKRERGGGGESEAVPRW